MLFSKKKKRPFIQKHKNLHRLGLFLVFFSAVGGGLLLLRSSAATSWASPYRDPHGASCTRNAPSKTFVKPGEKFTAQVWMQNTGTSTFSKSYAFFLDELNNDTATNYWNAQGGTLAGDVPPGGTATFTITATAPAQPATYPFNWAMAIVYQGAVHYPCSGSMARTVTVKNPPAVSLNLNGQPSNISVTQGTGLTVSWSASNGATSCSASGNWSGAKSPPSGGSENRTADTATTGTKTYTLVCSNEVGSSASLSRSVVVNAAAAPAPAPAPSGSAPRTSSPSSSVVPVVTTDTTPPSAPTNFAATYDETHVALSWGAASDQSGIKGYELERSTDQTNWQKIGETITAETYEDEDVTFETTYYYRLRSLDQAGNASEFVTTEIKTGSFDPNAKADESLVLTSDDGVAKVTLPAGALTETASCNLKTSRYLQPSLKGYASISGPYELLCKVASGNRITVFAKPVTVQVNLSDSQKKRYTDYKFYTRGSDWDEVKDIAEDNSFVLGESTDFALLGKIKTTPLWQKILITLFILAGVVGVGLVGLARFSRWRLRRRLEQQNRDNYYKERGY